jgi:hypothetical protein
VNKVENLLVKFDSSVQPEVLLTMRSTAGNAIHLQFDGSAYGLDIRAL